LSEAVPHGNITASGPMTRGDLLMMLYWFSDTSAVPDVQGIRGLSRLTRMAIILGRETGLDGEIRPYFTFHTTPQGGIASVGVWEELLRLRSYQVTVPIPSMEAMPKEELAERRYLLEEHIPPHERSEYPLPTEFERDALTNKGTFFAAKREDQMMGKRIDAMKRAATLERLTLAELTAMALPLVRVPAGR
jgi:hypothetical protein